MIVSTTLNYRVDPAAVQNLYRTVGPNWFDTLVEPRINQFFKAETVKYDTVDIAPNREQIRLDVQEKLDADLRQFSITVEDLLIDNIDFTPAFKQSIEEKQITAQNALREEERIRQIQNEAQQVEERAKGQRAEREELAAGDAEARRIRARGRCGCHPSPCRGLSRAQHGPHAGGPAVLRRGQALSQRQHRPHPQRSGGHHRPRHAASSSCRRRPRKAKRNRRRLPQLRLRRRRTSGGACAGAACAPSRPRPRRRGGRGPTPGRPTRAAPAATRRRPARPTARRWSRPS